MSGARTAEFFETIVIGGGQAGLATGYHLSQQGIPFVILDANERIGDGWRKRWDSLRLFTPARIDSLPGMRFPGSGSLFPTKDEMAEYLEAYARRWSLPVRTSARVDRLYRTGDRFAIDVGDSRFEANEVVVAMSSYQTPRTPSFVRDLDPEILQIHAHHYRNPSQLQAGPVLVVGVGNSGADIGIEVVKTHPTIISGKEAGYIPWRIETVVARSVMVRVMRFVGQRILTVDTPIGRKARPKMLHRATPLIRVKPKDLTAAGIERVPRVVGARNGRPLLADERTLDVRNVIWCTGFEPGFSWIDLPVFGPEGDPMHKSGLVAAMPGLYFVGLHFLHSMTSATVTGVGADARRVVGAITARVGDRRKSAAERVHGRHRVAGGRPTTASR